MPASRYSPTTRIRWPSPAVLMRFARGVGVVVGDCGGIHGSASHGVAGGVLLGLSRTFWTPPRRRCPCVVVLAFAQGDAPRRNSDLAAVLFGFRGPLTEIAVRLAPGFLVIGVVASCRIKASPLPADAFFHLPDRRPGDLVSGSWSMSNRSAMTDPAYAALPLICGGRVPGLKWNRAAGAALASALVAAVRLQRFAGIECRGIADCTCHSCLRDGDVRGTWATTGREPK
jgi:hypothetical protein